MSLILGELQNGTCALIIATENGHEECVRVLMGASGIDVNAQDEVSDFLSYGG